jgi:hypothetical protein
MTEAGLARVERSESYIVGVDDAISTERLLEQVGLIQRVMKNVMSENEHYGIIPGTGKKCPDCRGQSATCPKCKGSGIIGKPSLLKPGAEKLCFTFRMDPEFDVEILPIQHKVPGHREYRIKCTLFSINSGQRLGSGVGSASTMESKWRFRTGPKDVTDKPVPKEYWDNRDSDPKKAQELIGGKGFSVAKGEDKKWYIAIQGEKVENDNPADLYNTVLKVGKKRALVDAVLTCTAASDCFTQDVEELVDNGVIVPATAPVSAPRAEAANPVATTPATVEKPPPATTPAGKEPEKSIEELRHDLGELAQIAVEAGIYSTTGDAVQDFASDEKFKSKCRDVAGMQKDWAIKKAITKANAVLNSIPARVDSGDDQDIPL